VRFRAYPGREAVDNGHDRPLAAGPPLRGAFERRQESRRDRHCAEEVLQRKRWCQCCWCQCLVLHRKSKRPGATGGEQIKRCVQLQCQKRIADAGEVRSWLPSSGARGAVRGVGKRPRNWYQAVLPRGETHRRAIEAISRSGSNSTNDLAVAHRNRAMDGHQAVTHSSCRFWCKRMLRSILTFSVRDLHRLSRVRPRANPITVCISLAMLYDISTTVPGGRSGSEGDPCQPGAVAQRQQAH